MCAFLRRARTGWSVVLLLFVCTAHAAAVRLASDTLVGWIAYVNATETRIQHELASPSGFLVMDFVEDAAADRRATLGGTVVVQRMETIDARDRRTIVPSALVHHWRGDVLIPGVTVTQLVSELLTGPPPKQEDVLQSSVLERGPDRLKVYLKLQRKRLVTVVYNTEHVVTFSRYGGTRATSTSIATRIAELADAGTPEERELPAGDDRGFLWRLNAYWRYEEVPAGVIAECESISLSRDVPALLRYLVNPLIESTARESMMRTLITLRAHFARSVRPSAQERPPFLSAGVTS
jgi:hypothetical protein